MRSVEAEGDSIDQAISEALNVLQVGRDRVEITILEDSARGLFGFGAKKARVRATVRAPVSATFVIDDTAEGGVPRETPVEAAPAVGSPPERPARQTERPRTAVDAEPRAARHVPVTPVAVPTDASREASTGKATAVLRELLGHLGLPCKVEVRAGEDPGMVVLDVSGDGGGLVIGRRGQTLDAIEYVLNRIVGRDGAGSSPRFVVDVERYRERRREYLEQLALRLADKVKQTGRPVTLNPMSPRDRRLVHLAIQGDAAVTTRSQGEGHYRKVLIVPARGTPRPTRPPR